MNRPALGRWLVRFAVPPLVLLAIVIAVWDAATVVFSIEKYLLPRPGQVFLAGWRDHARLLSAALVTGEASVCGFLLSFVVGLGVACVFSQSRVIQRMVYPYAIFLQTVPIIAVAPLIVVWFGYGFQSVVVVAFIISLFPIITNATTGLTAIDRNLLEWFELAGASRWQLLWKLRLPGSVPHLVVGAKISAGLAVVGAIVGEIFAGAAMHHDGLGNLINQTNANLSMDTMFAAVLTSTCLGIVIFGTVSLIGAWVLARWQGAEV
ncbi:MAG TPA: ABC transporter permease [Pirellulales bacterium]|nr:ABC transporter permease [Pirellulales bacterium]